MYIDGMNQLRQRISHSIHHNVPFVSVCFFAVNSAAFKTLILLDFPIFSYGPPESRGLFIARLGRPVIPP